MGKVLGSAATQEVQVRERLARIDTSLDALYHATEKLLREQSELHKQLPAIYGWNGTVPCPMCIQRDCDCQCPTCVTAREERVRDSK